MDALTDVQKSLFEYIKGYKAENDGRVPSRKEMAKKFEVSETAINNTLDLIAKKGYIRIYEGMSRAIRVLV